MAAAIHNVAANLEAQGKYTEAEPLHERALAISRKVVGEVHPDTVQAYTSLGHNLYAQSRIREAIVNLRAAARIFEGTRAQAAVSGFERSFYQRDVISPHIALAMALAEAREPAEAWYHAEAFLARGLLDDLDASSRQNAEMPARLAKLDEELLPLLGRSNLSDQDCVRRESLQKEADSLRKARIQAAAERSAQRIWRLDRIQSAIPAETAVVFWIDLPGMNHWACILRRTGPPIWQQLPGSGPGKAWTSDDDSLVQRAYDVALVRSNGAEPERLLSALRVQRLDPLLMHLYRVNYLLIIPVGRMALVPIEALTDRFTVSYISSASVYAQLRQQHRPLQGSRLLALGDPVFTSAAQRILTPPGEGLFVSAVVLGSNADRSGLKAGDILVTYNKQQVPSLAALKPVTTGPPVPAELWREGKTVRVRLAPGKLGVLLDKRPAAEAFAAWQASGHSLVAQQSGPITPLPGSKLEVESLARLVPETKLLLGSDASEQTLEELAQASQLRNYRLLHLATHAQVNLGIPKESSLILAQDHIIHKLDDQIARTLGGNKPLDGRLTVGTILEKWQLDADQVVLSACETGLGAEAAGEGLLGFAQALLQKGARTVVLSRWKVPDMATALLMQRYYQNILGKREGLQAPMPRAEGLWEAKRWLRSLTQAEIEKQLAGLPGGGELRSVKPAVPVVGNKRPPAEHPFAAPYYWAAFVLIGDPE
jgi:hypothetical protein